MITLCTVAVFLAIIALLLRVEFASTANRPRTRCYVYNRAGRAILAVPATLPTLARLVAATARGYVSTARGTLPPSARCRIDGQKRYTRCAIVAERPRSYIVRLPNGAEIVRRRPLVILSSRHANR